MVNNKLNNKIMKSKYLKLPLIEVINFDKDSILKSVFAIDREYVFETVY